MQLLLDAVSLKVGVVGMTPCCRDCVPLKSKGMILKPLPTGLGYLVSTATVVNWTRACSPKEIRKLTGSTTEDSKERYT